MRPWRRIAVAAVVLVTVLGGRDVVRVAAELRAARHAVDELAAEWATPTEALRSLRSAADHMDAAQLIASDSLWLDAVKVLPLMGGDAGALQELVVVGSDALRSTEGRAQRALEALGASGGTHSLATRLGAARDELASLRSELASLDAPPPAVLGPLESARRALAGKLALTRAHLRDADRALAALQRLVEGPSRYLVLAANNAEMRGGAAMPLSIGLLHVSGGEISGARFRPAAELELPAPVPVPAGLTALYDWLELGSDWRDTATSPNFPAVAPVYRTMAEAAGMGEVDGVVLLDVVGLAQILEVVGPVMVDDLLLDHRSVEHLLLHDLYERYDRRVRLRREVLGRVSVAVLSAINERPWAAEDLGAALLRAARGRHLLLWSESRGAEHAWRKAGADGSLDPGGLMIAVQNHGANKLDPHLDIAGEVATRRVANRREVDIALRLENRSPRHLPSYVEGPGQRGLDPGDHRALVTFYLPKAAVDVRAAGGSVVAAGEDGPMRVIGVRTDVIRGASAELSVTFRLPPDHPPLRLLPGGRSRPLSLSVAGTTVTDAAPTLLPWEVNRRRGGGG